MAPGAEAEENLPAAVRRPAAALAWSESRIEAAGTPDPGLALWLPAGTTVAIGLGQRPEDELDVGAMRRDGVGLVRRQSGGGAVLLYPGVLCWEAWAGVGALEALPPGGSGIRQAYAALCRPVLDALRGLGIAAFQAGICDISAQPAGWPQPRKLAGSAQLRRRGMVLVHGSLLVNPRLDLLGQYLRFPGEQPDYRHDRPHAEFCVTLAELAADSPGRPLMNRVAGAIVDAALRRGWGLFTPPARLDGAAARLESEKYLSDDWNWRRIRR